MREGPSEPSCRRRFQTNVSQTRSRRHASPTPPVLETLQSILGLAILRVVLVFHVLTVFAQSVFAGQFLSGSDSPVTFHELTGWIVLFISVIQIILAAVLVRRDVTSLWLVFRSIFLFLGEGLQIGTRSAES